MIDVLSRWVEREVEWASELGVLDVAPTAPRFRHRPVQLAYSMWENKALSDVRQGKLPTVGNWPERFRYLEAFDGDWAEPTGFVYWMTPSDERDSAFGAGKIGYSSDPEARLRQVQTGCPVALALAYQAPAPARMERTVHSLLASDRLRGEWFRITADAGDVVTTLYVVSRMWALLTAGVVR